MLVRRVTKLRSKLAVHWPSIIASNSTAELSNFKALNTSGWYGITSSPQAPKKPRVKNDYQYYEVKIIGYIQRPSKQTQNKTKQLCCEANIRRQTVHCESQRAVNLHAVSRDAVLFSVHTCFVSPTEDLKWSKYDITSSFVIIMQYTSFCSLY